MTPEEREQVRQHLQEYAAGTLPEWLRSMQIEVEDHPLEGTHLYLEWQTETEVHIKESRYAEPMFRAHVRVEVELLPDLPPIGPAEWVPATFLMCLASDRIRIGATESEVLRSSSGVWNANNADAWHPTPWKHTELRMDLSANPGFQEYPPNTACEILMTPERKAVHYLMQAFPGTQPVDK